MPPIATLRCPARARPLSVGRGRHRRRFSSRIVVAKSQRGISLIEIQVVAQGGEDVECGREPNIASGLLETTEEILTDACRRGDILEWWRPASARPAEDGAQCS